MTMQSALAFLQAQASFIEREAYRIARPPVQYASLVPVLTDYPDWVPSITQYATDGYGEAEWMSGDGTNFAMAEVQKGQEMVHVHMANIGYRYNVEEIQHAILANYGNLNADKAVYAREAYERKLDEVVLYGSPDHRWDGLINQGTGSGVRRVDAFDGDNSETGDEKKYWYNKDADEILFDVNRLLTGVHISSRTVEMANTLALPPEARSHLATRRLGDTQTTVLKFLMENNEYTTSTGNELVIRTIRGLDVAGEGTDATWRMIAYDRDPRVLRFYLPMPHRFLRAYAGTGHVLHCSWYLPNRRPRN